MKEKIMPKFVYLGELEGGRDIVATTIKLRCSRCNHEWVSTVRNGYVAEYELDCFNCKKNYREEHWEQARDS